MKKILITGCNGYIGSCICAFLSKKYFLIGIDKKKNKIKNKFLNVEYNIDLNDLFKIESKLLMAWIYMLKKKFMS